MAKNEPLQEVACAFFFLAAMAAFSGHSLAGEVSGFASGVSDGDTFYMVIDGKSTRLRLAEVDAPEKKQPFGRRAEQSLRALLGERPITVTWDKVDRYGRPIVQVYAEGVNVNAEQVGRGFAWVYRQYAKNPHLYVLENEARLERRGLWADPLPIEPWVWRKAGRKKEG